MTRCTIALATALLALSVQAESPSQSQWQHVGGDLGHTRYSPLTQINRGNVEQLEVLWTYRHGDVYDPRNPDSERSGTAFQATPILVEGQLVFPTPYSRVIALDPETGEEIWTFDPGLDPTRHYGHGYVNRGVSYWKEGESDGACSGRIFVATTDARLIAIDSATGKPCRQFGDKGTVNLHAGVENLRDSAHFKLTSAPIVVGDAVIVGASLPDDVDPQPSGNPRAYDARTGRLLWRFNVVPRKGETGAETWLNESWRDGYGANPWALFSADAERNTVFIPTSAPSPHYYGGHRPGDNLFGNTVLALNATTGERRWHFQAVHHDIWDYDLAAPPILATLESNGRSLDAVIVLTKMGFVFVLDRDSGEPLFPIEHRKVPAGGLPGERTARRQPFPVSPPPLVPIDIDDDALWHDGPSDIGECRRLIRQSGYDGIYTPFGKKGSLLYPSNAGGANWSGGAYDPERQILYVPVNNLIMYVDMAPAGKDEQQSPLWLPSTIRVFTDSRGIPCLAPPWGMIVAVDMTSGKVLWKAPTGRSPDGIRGLPNMGPMLVTAGGLVFHGGTAEPAFYAYDAATGETLARFEVPAGVHGGPMTYRAADGKQILLVTPGGHHRMALHKTSPLGDWITAYALPD